MVTLSIWAGLPLTRWNLIRGCSFGASFAYLLKNQYIDPVPCIEFLEAAPLFYGEFATHIFMNCQASSSFESYYPLYISTLFVLYNLS